MPKHTHRAIPSQSSMRGYCGHSVRPDAPNPLAHGGVTITDYCRCGATRRTNSTGIGRRERGRWSPDRDDD
jgi:hypothetical protein